MLGQRIMEFIDLLRSWGLVARGRRALIIRKYNLKSADQEDPVLKTRIENLLDG